MNANHCRQAGMNPTRKSECHAREQDQNDKYIQVYNHFIQMLNVGMVYVGMVVSKIKKQDQVVHSEQLIMI